MTELIILICWHAETDREKILAFRENKKTYKKFNPHIEIVVVKNLFKDPLSSWLSSDLTAFFWYKKNWKKKQSKRYLIVEWDSWCDCDMLTYFKRVWDCDLVVPSIKYPERDDWFWFKTINQLPEHARPFAVGVTPFCGILLSDRAMKAITEEIIKPEYLGLNSELRLGTIATMMNFDPIVNPVYSRSIGWRSPILFDLKYKGIHHPRKKIEKLDSK